MSLYKEALKQFRNESYTVVEDLLCDYLEDEPEDFNALLLQGKNYLLLRKYDLACGALETAAKLKKTDTRPVKGLLEVFLASKDYEKLLETLESYILLLQEDGEPSRQEATDRFQSIGKIIENSAPAAVKESLLELQIPGSSIYDYLKGRMAPPLVVLKSLIRIKQKQLNEAKSKLQSKAKMSISMTPKVLTASKLALYNESPLPRYLEQLINISDEDAERRDAESHLLSFKLELLELVAPNKKAALRDEVKDLAEGMTLFKPHTEKAFFIAWDWNDFQDYSQLDPNALLQFQELFPQHGFSNIIDAFLHSSLSPFTLKPAEQEGEEQPESEPEALWPYQNIVDAFDQGYSDSQQIVLANRIIADFYVQAGEYEKSLQLAQEGLRLIGTLKNNYSITSPNAERHLSQVLGTCYIYVQPPKNFGLATEIFEKILKTNPEDVGASVGQGLILLEQNKLKEAEAWLQKVVDSHPDNIEALSQLSWCKIRMNEFSEGREGLLKTIDLIQGSSQSIKDKRALFKWRIGFSYWQEKDLQQAFDFFLKSLQENPSFAPAFTYIGLFYTQTGDSSRATRAFHKALEIDSGEVLAGRYLASEFAAQSQWDLVEIVASRVLESDRVGRVDPLTGEKIAWPFRAMGIVSLNKSNYSDAVSYFQRCLRLTPSDANSWVGLGEAYTNTGRYISAEKALNHAIELDPTNLSALYELSMAQRETLQFAEAAQTIQKAMALAPENTAFISTLVDNHVKAGQNFLQNSYLGDAISSACDAVSASLEGLKLDKTRASLWTGISSACEVFLLAQSHYQKLPLDNLNAIRVLAGSNAVELELDEQVGQEFVNLLVDTLNLCAEQSLAYAGKSKASRAVAHFNVALAAFKSLVLYAGDKSQRLIAIDHLKQAIMLEPRNDLFWNFYGVVLHDENPEVAQHCFVRSLVLNGRSTSAWTNLGVLYLTHGDASLGSDALDRALTVEPDNNQAWVGQALVEQQSGKGANIDRLLEQAYGMSPGNDKVSKLLLGYAALERAFDAKSPKINYQAIGAIDKLLALEPHSEEALLLAGLLFERSGDFSEAVRRLTSLEATYQDKTKLHAHLARVHLGAHNWEKAIEYSSSALEDDRQEVYLSSLLTSGLAYYFVKDFENALEMFTAAMETPEADRDVVILLVQVLWANGGEEERAAALEQLYDSIGTYGASLKATLLLGLIGFLGDESDVVDAAREELLNTELKDILSDKDFNIPKLLSRFDGNKNAFYRALLYSPSSYELWKHVNTKQALEMAKTHSNNIQELSDAYVQAGQRRNLQRAVFYAPNNANAWRGLASCAHETEPEPEVEQATKAVSSLQL